MVLWTAWGRIKFVTHQTICHLSLNILNIRVISEKFIVDKSRVLTKKKHSRIPGGTWLTLLLFWTVKRYFFLRKNNKSLFFLFMGKQNTRLRLTSMIFFILFSSCLDYFSLNSNAKQNVQRKKLQTLNNYQAFVILKVKLNDRR